MIVGVLITAIACVAYLSYTIGAVTAKVASLDSNVKACMQKNDMALTEIGTDIKEMKSSIAEIRIKMAEMRVKVDELLDYHLNKVRPTKHL